MRPCKRWGEGHDLFNNLVDDGDVRNTPQMRRQDIGPDDVANYFDSSLPTPDKLMTFVRHCELDAHYQMAIAARVQILPLTKQLTNLAGNSW